jgi:phosphoserine phosphatase RsbU/P
MSTSQSDTPPTVTPPPATPTSASFLAGRGPWRQRLAFVVDTMRELSRQSDPESLVRAYGERMEDLVVADRFVALSRRDCDPPWYRITRSDLWTDQPNPWRQRDRLPLLEGGLFAELIYGDEPRIINDLADHVRPDDPALEQFTEMRSLVAVPNYDQGVGLNMIVLMRRVPDGYDPEGLPEQVWMSNLFGRATHNLVLRDEVQRAYEAVDRELQVVSDIQRSLLPVELPNIPTLGVATYYQTSQRAGGDYYDFFPLPDGRWGLLIADVSGHGTPAAVLMAVTHSIAHTHGGPPDPPSRLLNFINAHLAARYTNGTGSFVTAFYGIYDPKTYQLTYANAGHNPPRIKPCKGEHVVSLGDARNYPLGIDADEVYTDRTVTLTPGDTLLFYTDGITEARNATGEFFGVERLDEVLERCGLASMVIDATLEAVDEFTGHRPPADDRTLLVAQVTW